MGNKPGDLQVSLSEWKYRILGHPLFSMNWWISLDKIIKLLIQADRFRMDIPKAQMNNLDPNGQRKSC
jgi:hypothetical protein